MVSRGALGTYKPAKMTSSRCAVLIASLSLVSLLGGYNAAIQPPGAGWRFFSWHPFLMTVGFVGFMGGAVATKKMGGYANTKIHGIASWTGLILAFAGLYVIYRNKENMGKPHITSNHSILGLVCLSMCTVAGMAGGIFLHPDFGIDKKNKDYRLIHQWVGRVFALGAWATCVSGLAQLTSDTATLVVYGLPLLLLVPFVLM